MYRPAEVVKAYPLHNLQNGCMVDVKCPLCSTPHQYYVTPQNDAFHKCPECDPRGRDNLEFYFTEEIARRVT